MHIKHGLIVYEDYARMLVRGLKKRELRSYRTNIRGNIGIIANSRLYGIVSLTDVEGPYEARELLEYYDYHRVKPNVLLERFGNKSIRVRKVEPVVAFEEPIPIRIKRGARIRVRLDLDIKLNNI